VRSVLGPDEPADALYELIVVKAEGNPFFVEELARTVREQIGGATPMTVPDTVEEVLGGRIDRLAPEERRLLEVAAVVGKDVPFAVVNAVAGLPEDTLARAFERLKAAEFLRRARGRTPSTRSSNPDPRGRTSDSPAGAARLHARIVQAIERS
jgi:predicted ATPase